MADKNMANSIKPTVTLGVYLRKIYMPVKARTNFWLVRHFCCPCLLTTQFAFHITKPNLLMVLVSSSAYYCTVQNLLVRSRTCSF